MNKQETQHVIQSWNMMLDLYGRAPINDAITQAFLLDVFEGCSANDVLNAIKHFLREKRDFPPTPGLVRDFIDQQRGGSPAEQLRLKAEKAYQDLDNAQGNSADDWIIADKRTAATVIAVFGTPQAFRCRAYDSRLEEKKKAEFISRFMSLSEGAIQNVKQCFGGKYANSFDPIVRFVGNYQACRQLVKEYYADRKPRLPNNPVTVKKLEAPKPKDLSPAEKAEAKKAAENALNFMQQWLSKASIRTKKTPDRMYL